MPDPVTMTSTTRSRAVTAVMLFGMLALAACSQSGMGGGVPTPHLADAALTGGYPQMALNVADSILGRDPRNVPALVARGDALYALGRPENAATSYRKALAISPNDAAANAGLGRILVKSDPNAAARVLRASLSTRPDDPAVLANLGVALDLQERHVEAQVQYRRSLALAPHVAATRTNLGLSLALSGDTAGARALLAPLAAEPDASASAHDNMEVVRMLSGAPDPVRMPAVSSKPVSSRPVASKPVAARSVEPRPAAAQMATARSVVHAAAGEPVSRAAGFAQLSAADSEWSADAVWQRVLSRYKALLPVETAQIAPASVNGHAFWRVRVKMASVSEARGLCSRLLSRGVACWAGGTGGA